MSGEENLTVLLQTLQPVLDEREFGFGVIPSGSTPPHGLKPIGIFEEEEGTTIIAPSAHLATFGIEHSAGWAKISLKVHSSLSAVGLTAAIAGALAGAGVSANIVAGYFHDHVFVRWDRRHEAMAVLAECSGSAANA